MAVKPGRERNEGVVALEYLPGYIGDDMSLLFYCIFFQK